MSIKEAMNTQNVFEHFDRMKLFYGDRSIVSELEKDEIPYAVIVPKAKLTHDSLKQLAHALKTWESNHPLVKRILGLDRMLQGKFPEVAVTLLMIPFWFDVPEFWVESVALVTVKQEGCYPAGLVASLCTLLKDSTWATAYSWEMYSDMNR